MTPDLILLDCDGVIVDTEPTTNAAMAKNLAQYGMQVTAQDCIDMFVGGTIAGVGDQIREMGVPIPDDWADQMYQDMFAALRAGVDVFPGVFEFLDLAAEKNIPVCVISNGPLDKMKITLNPHGLWDRLDGRIYSGHTKGNAKPDPGMLIEAMDRFGADPTKTWMVDDSKSGLTAGIRAGVQTFAFVPSDAHLPDVAFSHRVFGFPDLSKFLAG